MSGIGTGTALLIGGLGGAAAGFGGAALQSSAAGNAADTQANAADRAAQLQYQASQNALDFEKQQWGQQQANMAPWLQTGSAALGNLGYLMGLSPNQGSFGVGSPGAPTTPPFLGGGGGTGATAGGAAPGSYPFAGGGMPRPMPLLAGQADPTSGARMVGPQGIGGDTGAGGNIPVQGPVTLGGGYGFGSAGSPLGQNNVGNGTVPGATRTPMPVNAASAGGGFGSLMQDNPYSVFNAPTGLTMQNDPGYQARMQLGTDALQRSAAARGGLLTGGTAKALETYGQDYGSNEYGNVYNRAFNTNAYNYNSFNQNKTNQFNRLADLAGIGQQTALQEGYLGNQAANNVSSNLLNTAGMMGQQYNNAAAANASGMVGSANAWAGAMGGATNNLMSLYMMNQLQNGGGGGGYLGMQGSLLGQSIF